MPLVSVLMTSYNREKYIGEAIQSVLESTFQDFEVIIVDDCSKDQTVRIAQEFAERDKRIRLYINEQNLGDYPNRNKAASYASGKYLKYVDSDDQIYKHGLAVMVDAMERYPSAGLGISRPPLPDRPYPSVVSPREAYTDYFLGGGILSAAPLTTIVKTSVFHELGGFSGRRYVGDTECWLKIAGTHSVLLLPDGLTWWRAHGNQEFAFGHNDGGYAKLNYQVAIEALSSPSCPLTEAENKAARYRIERGQSRLIIKNLMSISGFQSGMDILKCSDIRLAQLVSALLPSRRQPPMQLL